MKGIKEFLINESNNDIKKYAKYLAKIISNKSNNEKLFKIFINELIHNIDDDNPDELFWNLLSKDYEDQGWTITKKLN